MPKRKTKPIDALMAAADAYSIARAEANWTNGYRARFLAGPHDESEATRLYKEEMAQWNAVGVAEQKMRRAFLAVLRDVKRTRPTTPTRGTDE